MKVEFVAFHMASTPPFDDKAERTSDNECGFFIEMASGDISYSCGEGLRGGRPRLPRTGDWLRDCSNAGAEEK